MPVLVVTEKPRVAEKLAAALSSRPLKKNLNGVNYFEVSAGNERVLIASAVGHIFTLAEKEKSSSYPVFDIEWRPSFQVSKEADYTKKYLAVLEKLGKEVDVVVNACDYDLEGDVIGGNIIRFACGKGKKAKRMVFSTLTKEDLVEAFNNIRDLEKNNLDAGEARHLMDWFWGINTSRALMQAIRKAGFFKVLSIGRVQGPALEILAKREREIKDFVSKPYWQLFAFAKNVKFEHVEGKFWEEKKADDSLAKCSKTSKISKISKREFKQSPPTPFDLTSLQMEAYRCFGFAPTRTLDLSQNLYEAALISYPRTSSQKYPAKLNLKKIISDVSKNSSYETLAKRLLAANRIVPFEGKKEDPAHPAIHPTGQVPSKLTAEQEKLYDLIVHRFLACFAEDSLRESLKVELDSNGEKFEVVGVKTLRKNWIEFYAPYAEMKEVELPSFKEEEKVEVERFEKERKDTQPPKRFTQASIIKELEGKALGTKSTRAVIIETLYNRGYAKEKSIEITALGMQVASTLEKFVPEILSEKLTRKFEHEVEEIQHGKLTEEQVVESGKGALQKILQQFKLKEDEIGKELLSAFKESRSEENVIGTCPNDGNNLKIIRNRFGGYFVGCSGYPNCKTLYPLPREGLPKPTKNVCQFCNLPIVKIIRKGKKPYEMCLTMNCKSKENWGKWEKKPKVEGSNPVASAPVTESKPKRNVVRKPKKA